MTFFDEANTAGKEAMDNGLKSFSAMTKGFQQIAAQSTDFAKQSYEHSAQMFDQLSRARSLDKAMEVHGTFAKDAYERWVSQTTRVSELCAEAMREAYQPFEQTVAATAARAQTTARAA
ncbi:phasin family protein [Aureimonas mangrovi]|uniref:phasin family protein n=1 Tax=Aureimonas mangrovi TaxID=2758041 RepID=UPI00163D5196|nr:phasin family protein [Aureimonas mangrovi]